MSALMLIGAVPAEAAPIPEAGAHLHLPAGPLAGLAVEITLEDGEDEAERMLAWAGAQNRVLAHYIQDTDVLPISLGAVFSDPGVLSTHLQAVAPSLVGALAPLSERCEYILQISIEVGREDTAPRSAPEGGRAFLRDRQSRRDLRLHLARDRRQFVQMLDTALAQWCDARRPREAARSTLLWDLSLLVHRSNISELLSGLQDWDQRASGLDLRLTLIGPCPAYSFVEDRS